MVCLFVIRIPIFRVFGVRTQLRIFMKPRPHIGMLVAHFTAIHNPTLLKLYPAYVAAMGQFDFIACSNAT